MRLQVFASPNWNHFAKQFTAAWQERFEDDAIEIQVVETSQGMVLPSRLEIEDDADLLLVMQAKLTDYPGTQDLANLVVARARRLGIQPVVVLAQNTPLSKRQIQELGFSGTYFREEQPRRGPEDWGRILAQTWHLE